MSSKNCGRSPKDLRHLLNVARQDDKFFPEEIEVNLAKLKTLPKDELSENAMLRDRIDQQSELICILKKQADSHLNKSSTLEEDMRELLLAKEGAVCKHNDLMRKYIVLENRFETLFCNHEEIIKIKDGYKHVNDKLRKENADLINRKKEDEDSIISNKNATIKTLNEDVSKLGEKFQESEKEIRTLREKLISSEKQSQEVIKNLRIKVNNSEQKAQAIEKKEKTISLQLLSTKNDLKKFQEEKDEYTQVSSNLKQTNQKQELKITELLEKVKELEFSIKRQEDKFNKEARTFSSSFLTMVKTCSFVDCMNRQTGKSNINFHRSFGKMVGCHRQRKATKDSRVCAVHFKDDFLVQGNNIRLKFNAVPEEPLHLNACRKRKAPRSDALMPMSK